MMPPLQSQQRGRCKARHPAWARRRLGRWKRLAWRRALHVVPLGAQLLSVMRTPSLQLRRSPLLLLRRALRPLMRRALRPLMRRALRPLMRRALRPLMRRAAPLPPRRARPLMPRAALPLTLRTTPMLIQPLTTLALRRRTWTSPPSDLRPAPACSHSTSLRPASSGCTTIGLGAGRARCLGAAGHLDRRGRRRRGTRRRPRSSKEGRVPRPGADAAFLGRSEARRHRWHLGAEPGKLGFPCATELAPCPSPGRNRSPTSRVSPPRPRHPAGPTPRRGCSGTRPPGTNGCTTGSRPWSAANSRRPASATPARAARAAGAAGGGEERGGGGAAEARFPPGPAQRAGWEWGPSRIGSSSTRRRMGSQPLADRAPPGGSSPCPGLRPWPGRPKAQRRGRGRRPGAAQGAEPTRPTPVAAAPCMGPAWRPLAPAGRGPTAPSRATPGPGATRRTAAAAMGGVRPWAAVGRSAGPRAAPARSPGPRSTTARGRRRPCGPAAARAGSAPRPPASAPGLRGPKCAGLGSPPTPPLTSSGRRARPAAARPGPRRAAPCSWAPLAEHTCPWPQGPSRSTSSARRASTSAAAAGPRWTWRRRRDWGRTATWGCRWRRAPGSRRRLRPSTAPPRGCRPTCPCCTWTRPTPSTPAALATRAWRAGPWGPGAWGLCPPRPCGAPSPSPRLRASLPRCPSPAAARRGGGTRPAPTSDGSGEGV
uniref:Uncharacterized protein n=1 Tax=Auxenochlorella protothecoides TaxID=3075 RepID=A0A1D1ZXC9_AUXPR